MVLVWASPFGSDFGLWCWASFPDDCVSDSPTGVVCDPNDRLPARLGIPMILAAVASWARTSNRAVDDRTDRRRRIELNDRDHADVAD